MTLPIDMQACNLAVMTALLGDHLRACEIPAVCSGRVFALLAQIEEGAAALSEELSPASQNRPASADAWRAFGGNVVSLIRR